MVLQADDSIGEDDSPPHYDKVLYLVLSRVHFHLFVHLFGLYESITRSVCREFSAMVI